MRTVSCFLFFTSLFISSTASQERRVTLLFAGDAMQHLPQIESARTDEGTFRYDSCFLLVRDMIEAADIAGVNLETTHGGEPYSGYPTFSAPDAFALALKRAGFDLFFQANNHAVDRGRKGLEDTIDLLDSIGVKHTGTFKSEESRTLHYPLMIIKNGIRFAFLNYSYNTNGIPVSPPNIVNLIDTNSIKKDLYYTKRYHPDIIIAQMHWGNEYHTTPSAQQKAITTMLQHHGVQIVIGHHPHVVQPMVVKRVDDTIRSVVCYSLGNLISNQQRRLTDGGMMAEIAVSKAGDTAPVVIESCNYALTWVHKAYNKGKYHYRLIPYPADKSALLNSEEKQKMDTFVKNATSIIEKRF